MCISVTGCKSLTVCIVLISSFFESRDIQPNFHTLHILIVIRNVKDSTYFQPVL